MDENTTGIIVIGVVVGLPVLVGGGVALFKLWLRHRLEIAHIQAQGMDANSQKKIDQLQDRIAVLENQCAKLQEQVTTAHVLLADERHTLDRKLSAMLPDDMPSSDARGREPTRKTVGP